VPSPATGTTAMLMSIVSSYRIGDPTHTDYIFRRTIWQKNPPADCVPPRHRGERSSAQRRHKASGGSFRKVGRITNELVVMDDAHFVE
jgi:hypothetical protein